MAGGGYTVIPKVGDPGVYVIPELGNREIKLVELDEHDWHDTQIIAAGQLAANSILTFFATISATKFEIDQNIKTSRKLPGGESFVLQRLAVAIPTAFGNLVTNPADAKKAYENGWFEFDVNGDSIAEGACTRFPAGYGLTGMTNEADTGVLSNGVNSSAATAKLSREQVMNEKHEMDCTITYRDHAWDAANLPTFVLRVPVRVHAYGLRERAKGRG